MRQYKDYSATIKDVDEKGRVLVAANAIGNRDSDKDISHPGSFQKTLSENFARLKWFLNHNSDYLIGVPIEGKEKNPYLEMLGQINMKKQLGQDVYEDYKLYAQYGKSLEHSIGVEAVKKEQKDDTRHIYEWKLWEYSTLYGWGANENTPALSIKSEKSIADEIDWLEIKFRKGNFSDEKFLDIEKQLKLLRSLTIEPVQTTQSDEPIKKDEEPEITDKSTLPDVEQFIAKVAQCPNCNKSNYTTERGYIKCRNCKKIFVPGASASIII